MSSRSPHHHPLERKDSELTSIIAKSAKLRAHLAKTPTVDETHDVPDTGGYAKADEDDTVYIDRHLARAAPEIEGEPYTVWRQALIDHEWMEKGLVQILGYEYEAAHEFASMYEDRTVRRLNMRPFKYNKGLAPFIKRDVLERVTRPPVKLDCTPYKGPHQTADDKKIMARFADLRVEDAAGPKPAPPVVVHGPKINDVGIIDEIKGLRSDLATFTASIDRLCSAMVDLCKQKPQPQTLPAPIRARKKKIHAGRDKFGNMVALIEEITEPAPKATQ